MHPGNAPEKIFLLRGMRAREIFLLRGISVFPLHGTLPEIFISRSFYIIHNILYNLIYLLSTKKRRACEKNDERQQKKGYFCAGSEICRKNLNGNDKNWQNSKNFVFALKQLPILKFCDSMIVIKYTGRYILTKNKLQKTAVSSGTELIKLRFR